MKDYREIFSKRLNYYLFLNSKTQKDLSADLGFSKTIVNEWCKAKKMPRMDKVQAVAQYFGVKVSDLLYDVDDDDTLKMRERIFEMTAGASEEDLKKIIKMIAVIIGGADE